jgi:hypothetical protein
VLDQPAVQTRTEIQEAVLGDYHARRAALSSNGGRSSAGATGAVSLARRSRPTTTSSNYVSVTPAPSSTRCRPAARLSPAAAPTATAPLLDWPDHSTITTLAQRLTDIGAVAVRRGSPASALARTLSRTAAHVAVGTLPP